MFLPQSCYTTTHTALSIGSLSRFQSAQCHSCIIYRVLSSPQEYDERARADIKKRDYGKSAMDCHGSGSKRSCKLAIASQPQALLGV